MAERGVLPYGSWPSPIGPEFVAEDAVPADEARVDAGSVWWRERRPAEGGRYVLVRRGAEGGPRDVTPAGFNARTLVHEYGGGSYLVSGDVVVFSNFADQRLYRQDGDGPPRPITPEPPEPAAVRFADGRFAGGDRLVVCVRETHEGGEVTNDLCVVPADGSGEPRRIAGGRDFHMAPRPSPDGRRLAWLAWDHPRMPWDGTELWLADLGPDGALGEPRLVAGGPEESVVQPEWAPDGSLLFLSDRTGWWNLYREREPGRVQALAPMEAEVGRPAWTFGLARYAPLADGRIVLAFGRRGFDRLGVLEPGAPAPRELDLPYAHYAEVHAGDGRVVVVAGGPSEPMQVAEVDPGTGVRAVLQRTTLRDLDRGFVSIPRPIEFPTGGGLTAHGLFYPPANADAAGPETERPPLVVMSHGGPTSQALPVCSPTIQFLTSRGIAVVEVNYGGSAGYGRAYRNRLRGAWGVVDTADCVNAARWLAARDEVDGRRMAIRGGSAGGYATLCAITFHDVFAAGASYYGVGDLETLARETHKFESRYLDSLVGPYPEAAATYRERSPVHFPDRIRCPVILFQGLEDVVVPPDQARDMARALRANGVPHAVVYFEGEQHGFRRADTIRRSLLLELAFYGRVLGFAPAGDLPPLELEGAARGRP